MQGESTEDALPLVVGVGDGVDRGTAGTGRPPGSTKRQRRNDRTPTSCPARSPNQIEDRPNGLARCFHRKKVRYRSSTCLPSPRASSSSTLSSSASVYGRITRSDTGLTVPGVPS